MELPYFGPSDFTLKDKVSGGDAFRPTPKQYQGHQQGEIVIVTAPISRLLTAGALALACAVGFTAPGFAQGKNHDSGISSGATNSNGVNAKDRDKGADRAGDRMSPKGTANTNGANSTNRDKGKARAQDRSHSRINGNNN